MSSLDPCRIMVFAGLTPNPTYYFRIGVVILAGDQSEELLAARPVALPAEVSLWAPHLTHPVAIRQAEPVAFLRGNLVVVALVASRDVGDYQDGCRVWT